jgi:DNA polymerase-3 subunit alpha
MAMEKETTGLYISGHPMKNYKNQAALKAGASSIGRIISDFRLKAVPSTFQTIRRFQ